LKQSRLNPYDLAVTRNAMVLIQCPHCEEEVELDDDTFGEFQCPHCEGEFEWGGKPKARVKESVYSEPMSGTKVASHALHGAGGLMLIIGAFTGWIAVVIGDVLSAGPFGMKVSMFGFSAKSGWFNFFGDENSVLAIFGITFMILMIIAIVVQIAHLVFRVVIHMEDSGKLEVSMEMAYRSYNYRWHTSLAALICSVAGLIVMEIGLLIGFGDFAFPRPSLFAILLIGVLGGQFYMMNKELANE
jgi:hypothetical protein